jgi:hypothetical protein
LLNKPFPLTAVQGSATAVLFLSTKCHICSASMPFYRQMAALRTVGPRGFGIMVVFPEAGQGPRDGDEYLKGNELAVDGVQAARFDSLGISGTPTLALVDGSGIVRRVWRGKLSSKDEAELLGAINSLCVACRRVSNTNSEADR